MNIIIGENGSGKSTALEVLNFIFKRVLYRQYNTNQDLYLRRTSITGNERKQILTPANNQSYAGFRLEPNWDTERSPQKIRLEVKLDEIDIKNLQLLQANMSKLSSSVGLYTEKAFTTTFNNQESYIVDIDLNRSNNEFSMSLHSGSQDFGLEYLADYNFYKELINLHNLENSDSPIENLYESFTLIGGYRNYSDFNTSITLREKHPIQQIQEIKNKDFSRSLNATEASEPSVFGLVRLRVAEKHFALISQKLDEKECEEEANKLPFIQDINRKLKVVNLECKIKLLDLRTWQYSFEFLDLRRNRVLTNINSLSAGQKAIVHLVFEAYGRGDLKGGLVIIDEPEIHLHYQFQHEYLEVIRDLNREQKSQYVLVTHSEALINSSTINFVKRFSLNEDGNTEIKSPTLTTEQKTLIKILDNTRSTYAFFAKKVLLVEGDTDRYFFKAVIQELYPELEQEIAVLYMGGKGGYKEWSELFKAFGLNVYFSGDFDCVVDHYYPSERGVSLKTATEISDFKSRNTDWENKINEGYENGIFILKSGTLELHLGISKGLPEIIDFCNNQLPSFLKDDTNTNSKEIRTIIEKIKS